MIEISHKRYHKYYDNCAKADFYSFVFYSVRIKDTCSTMNLKEKYTAVFKFNLLCILILNVSGQIIRTEDDIRNAAIHAERMRTLTKARTKASPGAIKQNLFVRADDLAERAGQALRENVYQDTRSYNVSEVCLKDTEAFLEALISQELWALKSK